MKVGAAGGIDAIVRAINTHINNTGVCRAGCAALNNMTLNGKNIDKSIKQQNENEMNS